MSDIRAITRLQDADDVVVPIASDDGKVLMWNNTLQKAVWMTLAEVEAYGYSPSLNFSDERNSMYLGW